MEKHDDGGVQIIYAAYSEPIEPEELSNQGIIEPVEEI